MPKPFTEKSGFDFNSATKAELLKRGFSAYQIEQMSAANRTWGAAAVRKLQQEFTKPAVPLKQTQEMQAAQQQAQQSGFEPLQDFQITEQERADIEATQRAANQPFFDRQRSESREDFAKKIDAYDRLIGYAKTDTAKNLASQNKTFARSLERASNLYGQRGLVGSGIMRQQVAESTQDYSQNVADTKESLDRTILGYTEAKRNAETEYGRLKTQISENEDYLWKKQATDEVTRRQTDFYWNQMVKDRSAFKSWAAPTTPYTV